ncbi:MAG: hypothetical protein ACI89U_001000 [Gammaproteobacteria bacterium]|jgi:hypothetical protein
MSDSKNTLIELNSVLTGEWNQCQSLLNYSYPHSNLNNFQEIDKQQLLALLSQRALNNTETLVNSVKLHIDSIETLDADCYSVLTFVDQLFNNYVRNSKLHPSINLQLQRLKPAIAIALLNERLPWRDDKLAATFRLIYRYSMGWEPEQGRSAEKFLVKLNAAIDPKNEMEHVFILLNEFFEKDQKRIQKLESRLRDVEIGTLHAKHAQQLSAKTLNQHMAGKKLPLPIIEFLQGPWRESMRLLIVNKGKESEEWSHIIRLTETLIWSFQPVDDQDSERKQHIINSISEISEQLREATIGLHHSGNIDEELALIEQEHLKILKSETLVYQNFELIDNTDPLISSTASISKTLLDKVSSLSEGQWFIHHTDNGDQKIKLCVKISQVKQLLFTNFLGMKVSYTSFEDFAYLLSSKTVSRIDIRDPLTATGEKILSVLFERHKSNVKQSLHDQAFEKKIIIKQQRAREEARKKALLEAVALKKAHFRAQEIAKATAQFTTTPKKIELPEVSKQTRTGFIENNSERPLHQHNPEQNQEKKPLFEISDLNVGGKVVFQETDGETTRCKLAAIIQTSQHYIFVDRSGVKKYMLTKDELTAMLRLKSATILEPGSNFEGALERVVNNLRERKKL